MAYYHPPPYGYVPQQTHSTVVINQTRVVAPPVPSVQVFHQNPFHRTVYPGCGVVTTPGSVVIGGGVIGGSVIRGGVNFVTPGVTMVTQGIPIAPVAPVVGCTTTTYTTRGCQQTVYPAVRSTTTTVYKH